MSNDLHVSHSGILHPATLALLPPFDHLEGFMRSLPRLMAGSEGTTIHKGRNELRIVTAGGLDLVVKAFRRPHVINRFVYGTLRPSKAARSLANAVMLQRLGIGTPAPVGYYNVRGLLGTTFHHSYYVSLRSACDHRYDELLTTAYPYADDVARAIGRLTARLHEAHLYNKDYSRGNILFRRHDDGRIDLELVDLNRIYHRTLDVREGCRNFERLPATPRMQRLMAEAYAEARGFDADECYALIRDFRARQHDLVDGRY